MPSKIKFFTDIVSDLTESYINENNIGIIPMYYHFNDEKIYGDDINLSIDEFYKRINISKPNTMGCNPDKICNLFREVLIEDKNTNILCIMFSGALSVGYSSAMLAKELIKEEYPDVNIEIINSKRGSLAEGYMVKEAVRLYKEEQMDFKKIVAYLDTNANNFKCLFSVNTLDFLTKSGRISHIEGLLGNILNLKPIFGFNEEGKLYNLTTKRGLNKVLGTIAEDIRNFNAKEITICHANDLELALKIKTFLEKETNLKCSVVDLNFCVSANTGEHSFGISYYK